MNVVKSLIVTTRPSTQKHFHTHKAPWKWTQNVWTRGVKQKQLWATSWNSLQARLTNVQRCNS